MAIAFAAHTFGLLARMYVEGRPPVTSLYSSALFIGWGAVLLCVFMEKYHKYGIATAMGSFLGFGTLVIAHNLSLDSSLNPSGDTMEMMRAVLDDNFWLATHVVTVTIGYSTTFLAGFVGIVFVLLHVLNLTFDGSEGIGKKLGLIYARMEKDAGAMIYGAVCFALFFSFVGTVTGGIWADQSWGRFWGWDAKENGALLIVVWNALILHARWGGIAKTRGIACLAIFGNVVTSWSWFGTNLLGVGLHSYGFASEGTKNLGYFVLIQVGFIVLGSLPKRKPSKDPTKESVA
jgi:ABC-type transport system involved in cytochrome c biogenesis permease subunit